MIKNSKDHLRAGTLMRRVNPAHNAMTKLS
jgi:hypothetical protein